MGPGYEWIALWEPGVQGVPVSYVRGGREATVPLSVHIAPVSLCHEQEDDACCNHGDAACCERGDGVCSEPNDTGANFV